MNFAAHKNEHPIYRYDHVIIYSGPVRCLIYVSIARRAIVDICVCFGFEGEITARDSPWKLNFRPAYNSRARSVKF